MDPVHEEGRQRCTATTRSGERCANPPRTGTTVCRMHGGSSPQVRRAADARVTRDRAIAEARRLGGDRDVDPLDGLLELVREAAWNVEYLRDQVQDQANTQAVYDDKGRPYTHPVLAFYNEERDRLAKYSKLALDAGVDERRVRIAEADARRLVEVVRAAVEAMRPTSEQREAGMQAAAARMRELAGA